jgi:hypothetical protein
MIAVAMDEEPQGALMPDEIIKAEPEIKAGARVWVKRLCCPGVVQEVRWHDGGEVEYYRVRVGGRSAGALSLLVDPLGVGTWL